MHDLDWQDRAACRGAKVELFYSYEEEDVEQALAFCQRCEVRELCLEMAMEAREAFGVWGGTTERERRRIFRANRRRRQRQDPTAA